MCINSNRFIEFILVYLNRKSPSFAEGLFFISGIKTTLSANEGQGFRSASILLLLHLFDLFLCTALNVLLDALALGATGRQFVRSRLGRFDYGGLF